MKLLKGDCLEVLKKINSNSIDSLVTDPPAGIAFMNKDWDKDKGGRDQWVAWMTEVMRECHRVMRPGAHGLVWALPRTSHWTATALENAGFEVRDVVTHLFGTGFPKSMNLEKATDGMARGQGTALKPASEHWILVRKPIEKGLTVAENVLKWGVGGLNIDVSRIAVDWENDPNKRGWQGGGAKLNGMFVEHRSVTQEKSKPKDGRFPANLVLDEEAAAALDAQSKAEVSRFFYVAKASKSDKGADNTHPTVKNTVLMQYLIKLVTPPNGVLLDPFMGSGSTGVACKKLDLPFIGIEKEEEYIEIAKKRIGV